MKRLIASVLLLISSVATASAQSGCPAIIPGAVLTAAQWNNCFSLKQDALGFSPVSRNGDTMLGRLVTPAPGASLSGFNVTPGTAPAAPANGDIWATSAGLYAQIGGTTRWLTYASGNVEFSVNVNFNAGSTDTQIPIALPPGYARYRIYTVSISRASASITTATAGLFTGSGGTGTAIVTGGSALTVSTSADATLNNAQQMAVNNGSTMTYTLTGQPILFFRVATPQGSAATADVVITLQPLP